MVTSRYSDRDAEMLKALINQPTGEKSLDKARTVKRLASEFHCQVFWVCNKSAQMFDMCMDLFDKDSLGRKEAEVNVWKVGRMEERWSALSLASKTSQSDILCAGGATCYWYMGARPLLYVLMYIREPF